MSQLQSVPIVAYRVIFLHIQFKNYINSRGYFQATRLDRGDEMHCWAAWTPEETTLEKQQE